MTTTSALLDHVVSVAREAAAVIMQIYRTDFEVRGKDDNSPVTQADEKAESVIVAALQRLTPDIPIVAEEAVAAGKPITVGERFWLVDPLDGTKEFFKKNGEFTVNIALIEQGRPVLGVVYAPAIARRFWGAAGLGAWVEDTGGVREIMVRTVPKEGMTVLSSRSHANSEALADFLTQHNVARVELAGSSLKICLIAAGEADMYPRFGPTMEWDLAAGHAVLRAAGGRLTDLDGHEMQYGKPGLKNPNFVARGA